MNGRQRAGLWAAAAFAAFAARASAATNDVAAVTNAPSASVAAATNAAPAVAVSETNATNAPAAKPAPPPPRLARITSDSTYYDRKEGMAVFTGHVHVDDEQYQMHADKAYVFLTETNTLKRIVAIGGVALTNELKYATGAKASYYKEGGMVVLYGGDGVNAEVVDASGAQRQTLRGKKIKFWIDSEQVEVLDATIVAPVKAGKGILDR